MTSAEFDVILAARLDKVRAVLASKAGEYATDEDRLHNFKGCAREFGDTPAENLWGFMKKHLMSVRDMAKGDKPVTPGMVDEKVGDAINYLILLEAVFLESLHKSGTGD